MWQYPDDFRAALALFGLAPRPDTDPLFVRDALDALYRYELRRLRDRMLADEIPRAGFQACVVDLRRRYWLLTLPAAAWQRICDGSVSSTS